MKKEDKKKVIDAIEKGQYVIWQGQEWLLNSSKDLVEEMEQAYQQLEEAKKMIEDHEI